VTGNPAPHGDPNRYRNDGCRCPTCREGWAAYSRDRRRARAALKAPAVGADHQADNQPGPWDDETPFADQQTRHPRSGHCGKCGQPTTQATARGTFVWCDHHGRQWDAKTLQRIHDAKERLADADRRRRQLAATAKAKAKASQPRPLANQLDEGERIGKAQGVINGFIATLERAPTRQLNAQAAGIIARLQIINTTIRACTKEPNPLDALNNLESVIRAETARAETLCSQIESKRAELDYIRQIKQRDRPELPRNPEHLALPAGNSVLANRRPLNDGPQCGRCGHIRDSAIPATARVPAWWVEEYGTEVCYGH
jgi:hypothetical protein